MDWANGFILCYDTEEPAGLQQIADFKSQISARRPDLVYPSIIVGWGQYNPTLLYAGPGQSIWPRLVSMTNRLRRYDIIALLKQGKNLKVRVSHPSFGSELTLSYKGKRETVKKEKDLLVLQEGCLYMYRKQKESPYCAEFLADWKLNLASDTVLELNLEEEQYTLQVSSYH